MRRIVAVTLQILIIIAISVGLLELVLRVAAPHLPGQIGVVARYVTTGQPFSEAWTPAWRENRDHFYALRPGIENALQYGSPSVSFRLTTHKLWDDGLPPDEGIGFRTAPVDFAPDVVVVGDSFGFCFTEQADCWVDQLAAMTGDHIVNLSTPVTGSLSHARMIEDFAAPLEPPIVLWQFFGNDFYDDYVLHAWRGDIDPMRTGETVDTGGSWITRNTLIGALLELVATGTWSGLPAGDRAYEPRYSAPYPGGLLKFGKQYELTALDMSRAETQYGLEQTRAALRDAKARVEAWGGALAVVIIPTREEVYSAITGPVMGADQLAILSGAREAMHTLCAEIELPCFDAMDAFSTPEAVTTALYYADDMHLNPNGNRVLAEAVMPWLADLRGAND